MVNMESTDEFNHALLEFLATLAITEDGADSSSW